MFTKIFNRFRRAPAFAISILLLAGILCAALCGLQSANRAEEENYQGIRKNTPVDLIVTNLSGTRSTGLKVPNFAIRALTSKNVDNSLVYYVRDVQIRASYPADNCYIDGQMMDPCTIIGITDLAAAPELFSGSTDLVTWYDGYSEELLKSWDTFCIVPESWIPAGWDSTQPLVITYALTNADLGPKEPPIHITTELTVVGTHKASDAFVYCPYYTMRSLYSKLEHPLEADSIRGTLIDNDKIEELREVSKAWFAEPNPTGTRTPWRYGVYFSYPFALDIDNDVLVSAEQTLKTSILTNQICAYLLFVLSAGASFFVGFLMIRSRKREIALMRSVGTPSTRIFAEFVIEQMLCVLVGAILGGAAFLWQPVNRLLLFVGIYFVGLCIALVIFLRKNLMAIIKEDE